MVSILFKPTLHQFATCREFVEDFKLRSQDLILTNQYIYQPYFGQMGLGCQIPVSYTHLTLPTKLEV